MKQKTRIAFLYNVRHQYPDPNDPKTQLETDFDDPPVIRWMIKHLQACGYDVLPVEANERAYLKLYKNRDNIDLAFNYSEGIYGHDRECQMPAMLEMLQIPYLGSRPLTAALALNKARTKEILRAHGVSTLPFQVFKSSAEKLHPEFKYPLIVKPTSQGSGAGITNDSIVDNQKQLRRQIDFVTGTFKQPAMVEPFLTGREFSVPLIGNPPRCLPLIEPCHYKLPPNLRPIDSLEVKWFFEEESETNHLECPPSKASKALIKKVEKLCIDAWNALEIRDWCRMDIRCDKDENPYFIEVNIPAGLIPPEMSMTSYMPLSARAAGIEYEALLKLLVETALARCKK